MRYVQVHRGRKRNQESYSELIEMSDLYCFLDAVRVLQAGGYLSDSEQAQQADWLGHLHWLRTSEHGVRERASINYYGTYYDL